MRTSPFALAGAGALVVAGATHADFTGITGMGIDINPDPDVATVQLFANFDNPMDTLVAVGGIPGLAPVVFNLTTPLINDDGPFEGTQSADFPGVPISGPFDSWVSINQTTFADGDTDYSPDFTGVPTADQAILGTHWEEDDGGWFDSEPSSPEQGASMIIAQFTFEQAGAVGTLSGLVAWTPAGAGAGFIASEFDVLFASRPPAPATIALLGLAGLAGSRRRRA